MDLSGRLVMVTGASSGIGKHTAAYLSRLGARMVLVARNVAKLNETLASLEGGSHIVEPFDLESLEGIPAWMKQIAAREGEFTGIVHCAAVRVTKPLKVWNPAECERVFKINILSGMALAKGFRQRGVHAPGATLVLLSSVMGLVGASATSEYSASKGAVIGMTKSLAIELAPEDIRVNCVAPGIVRTPMMEEIMRSTTADQFAAIEKMHPLGLGEPDDIAAAAAYLLAASGRWITGTTLVIDGGYTAM